MQTTQVYQLFIKASPERVWEAITKPELIVRYFYGASSRVRPVAGGRWRAWTLDHSQALNDGEIIEIDEPRRFVHSWKALYDPELRARGGEPRHLGDRAAGGRLLDAHRRPRPSRGRAEDRCGVAGGWMLILSGLKTLVETGEPIVDFASS